MERGSAFRPVMDIGCWLLTLFAIVVGPGPASTEAEAEALDMVVAPDIRALVEVGPSASKWRRDDGAQISIEPKGVNSWVARVWRVLRVVEGQRTLK